MSRLKGYKQIDGTFIDKDGRVVSTISDTRLYGLYSRIAELEKTFAHTHVGPGDTCRQCGLDIRDGIHLRVDDPRLSK